MELHIVLTARFAESGCDSWFAAVVAFTHPHSVRVSLFQWRLASLKGDGSVSVYAPNLPRCAHPQAALEWGVFRGGQVMAEHGPVIVVFVDVGESATTISVVSFAEQQIKVRWHFAFCLLCFLVATRRMHRFKLLRPSVNGPLRLKRFVTHGLKHPPMRHLVQKWNMCVVGRDIDAPVRCAWLTRSPEAE